MHGIVSVIVLGTVHNWNTDTTICVSNFTPINMWVHLSWPSWKNVCNCRVHAKIPLFLIPHPSNARFLPNIRIGSPISQNRVTSIFCCHLWMVIWACISDLPIYDWVHSIFISCVFVLIGGTIYKVKYSHVRFITNAKRLIQKLNVSWFHIHTSYKAQTA